MCCIIRNDIKGGKKMKYIFNINYVKENELVFFIFSISMILIMILTVIFVMKETRK